MVSYWPSAVVFVGKCSSILLAIQKVKLLDNISAVCLSHGIENYSGSRDPADRRNTVSPIPVAIECDVASISSEFAIFWTYIPQYRPHLH